MFDLNAQLAERLSRRASRTCGKHRICCDLHGDCVLEIQTKVLKLHKAKRQLSIRADEYTAKLVEYSSQIRNLEQKRDKLHDKSTSYAEIRSWIRAFEENVTTGSIMTAQDSAVMRSIVSTIIVKEYGIELHLKCGVEFWQGFIK